MLVRSRPFRTLLAVVLAVAVPFCCCKFNAAATACASCVAAPSGERDCTGNVRDDHGCRRADARTADSDGQGPQGPASPDDGSDGHGCTCGNDEAKLVAREKPTIEVPTAVLVAILDWAAVAWAAPEPSHTFVSGGLRAGARPLTSLLSMHCALMV